MKYVLLAGRLLFSGLFLVSSFGHFSASTIGYASNAGVPFAQVLVPVSGVIELVGGLSILTGFRARAGAWLLVLFLIPVTFTLHAFWKIADPLQQQLDMANFMKNISLTGAALIIAYMGSGVYSIDQYLHRNKKINRHYRPA